MIDLSLNNKRMITEQWFKKLRDNLCNSFENLEAILAKKEGITSETFKKKEWDRTGGGGGEMSIMHGNVFEKVGVNISSVYGKFDSDFAKEMPGTEIDSTFFATGISVVAHPKSPLVPAAHFNTRYIETSKGWFGGGGDLTPTFSNQTDNDYFHKEFKVICDKYNLEYYNKFSRACDEYFFLKHRNEPRGIGGIFYDYLNTENFEQDFNFTKDVGLAFLKSYPYIVNNNFMKSWTKEQKEAQLIKRGRYVEFNLLYDRGTRFGLMTGGNIEAILMSLPPIVKWD